MLWMNKVTKKVNTFFFYHRCVSLLKLLDHIWQEMIISCFDICLCTRIQTFQCWDRVSFISPSSKPRTVRQIACTFLVHEKNERKSHRGSGVSLLKMIIINKATRCGDSVVNYWVDECIWFYPRIASLFPLKVSCVSSPICFKLSIFSLWTQGTGREMAFSLPRSIWSPQQDLTLITFLEALSFCWERLLWKSKRPGTSLIPISQYTNRSPLSSYRAI